MRNRFVNREYGLCYYYWWRFIHLHFQDLEKDVENYKAQAEQTNLQLQEKLSENKVDITHWNDKNSILKGIVVLWTHNTSMKYTVLVLKSLEQFLKWFVLFCWKDLQKSLEERQSEIACLSKDLSRREKEQEKVSKDIIEVSTCLFDKAVNSFSTITLPSALVIFMSLSMCV
jgi:hypothetical protein